MRMSVNVTIKVSNLLLNNFILSNIINIYTKRHTHRTTKT